jgi:hypothetical protein
MKRKAKTTVFSFNLLKSQVFHLACSLTYIQLVKPNANTGMRDQVFQSLH